MRRFIIRILRALLIAFLSLLGSYVMWLEGERIDPARDVAAFIDPADAVQAVLSHDGQPAFTVIESIRRKKTFRADMWRAGAASLFLAGGIAAFWIVTSSVVRLIRGGEVNASPLPAKRWSLDTPLLWFSKSAFWTIGAACQGCQIWGSTGSGKTTGSLSAICLAFLRAGFGGIFLTCKPDDRAVYERYIRAAGREADLMLFGPGHKHTFNFLDAELAAGAGFVENLTELLSTVVELADRNSGHGGRDDESFWRRMVRQLCRNSIQLLVMAKGKVRVSDLYRLVTSAPLSPDQVRSAQWQDASFCFQCMAEADGKAKTPQERADYDLIVSYFAGEWANLSDRTRSVVLSSFSTTIDTLNRGTVRDLISSPVSTIRPDMAQDGKLIIVDAPVMVHNEIGQYLQVIFKFCLQRAQNRRDANSNPRPVFIVCDESHLLAVSADQVFQTTARSTRTCVVYATQSISNYLAAFGGEKTEPEVHSLLGNLQLQVFHQQTDIRTNQYAADLVGRTRQVLCNSSNSYQQDDWPLMLDGLGAPTQTTAGMTETIDYELQPGAFTSLATGGPPRWEVEAIVYQGGKRFKETGRTWMPVTFRQNTK
ncbi:MAG: type IV secretory system conjugative DNA transfer family protein [Phycisphaerae bacterium]|nr:type IV secretion system DNA-binding domain-containing protein [Phycisphaerae bacterium]NUQ46558.1 type IV secretory system conjugative DNA transfer family protein [Phycisphaerae bacterium]